MLTKTKTVQLIKNKLQGYILMLVVFLAAILFYFPYKYNCTCGDFGLKINAAALQSQGKNAYFFINPDSSKTVTGVTSTPFLNMLHSPLINANACQVKDANFYINITLLFLCLLFTAWLTEKIYWPRIYLLAAIVVNIFVFSRPFYLNLLHGQVYVLYTLIFFLLLYLMYKKSYFLFGLVLIFACALRPVFLVGGLLALLYFNRKIFIGLFAGGLIILLITFFTGTAGYWKEYSAAMKMYSNEMPARMHIPNAKWDMHTIADINTFGGCTTTLSPAQTKAEKFIMRTGTNFPTLQIWLLDAHKNITDPNFYTTVAGILVLVVAISTRLRFKTLTCEKYMLLFFIAFIICELCIPAPRVRYSSIIWLFGISLMLCRANFVEVLLLSPGLFCFYNYHHYNVPFIEIYLLIPCLLFLFRKSETPYYFEWFKKLPLPLFKLIPKANYNSHWVRMYKYKSAILNKQYSRKRHWVLYLNIEC